ncbi:hypothetical protein RFI_36951, partial [Reticulomyxa filosa]
KINEALAYDAKYIVNTLVDQNNVKYKEIEILKEKLVNKEEELLKIKKELLEIKKVIGVEEEDILE